MSKPRRFPLGTRNIVGAKITSLRKEKHIKQKDLAAKLQSLGMDISESGLSRLECQERLVQDFEIPIIAKAADGCLEDPLYQLDLRAYDLWALGAGLSAGLMLRQGVAVI